MLECIFELYLSCLRRYSSLDHPPICILLISTGFEPFITIRSSSDYSCSRPKPKAQYMIWVLNPTIASQNSGFSLSSEEKNGILIFIALILFFPFDLHTWECCFAHPIIATDAFGAHEASLIIPGGIMFPTSNGEALIQWLIFLLRF